MKLEQKEPTKSIKERTNDVAESLVDLSWMYGFPAEEKSLKVIANAIAKFCETIEVNHTDSLDPSPHDLGWVVPIKWLVEEIASRYSRFPAPIVWRKIYCTRFVPLDRREYGDISGSSEE